MLEGVFHYRSKCRCHLGLGERRLLCFGKNQLPVRSVQSHCSHWRHLRWLWRTFGISGSPHDLFVAGQSSTDHYDLSAAIRDFGYALTLIQEKGWDE